MVISSKADLSLAGEPLLWKPKQLAQQERKQRYVKEALMITLFLAGKLASALGLQTMLVFAPFLAKDAGGLTFPQYRLGLVAVDLAAIMPVLLPVDRFATNAVGFSSMFVMAVSLLVAQLLPLGSPLALALCRFITGWAWTVWDVVVFSTCSTLGERQTIAIAFVELSQTFASLVVPLVGVCLDKYGATPTVEVLLVAPTMAVAFASLWLPRSVADDTKIAVEDCEVAAKCNGTTQAKEGMLLLMRRMYGALIYVFVWGFVNAIFMSRYGGWLHIQFNMNASQLGWFSNSIALGNVAGNLLTQLVGCFASQAVREVTIAMGALVVVMSMALMLTAASSNLWLFFGYIFLYNMAFECSMLTVMSYATYLCVDSSVTGLSLFLACYNVGRVLGDWSAPFPSMPLLFAFSAASFLIASGALATTPSVRSGQEQEIPKAVVE